MVIIAPGCGLTFFVEVAPVDVGAVSDELPEPFDSSLERTVPVGAAAFEFIDAELIAVEAAAEAAALLAVEPPADVTALLAAPRMLLVGMPLEVIAMPLVEEADCADPADSLELGPED